MNLRRRRKKREGGELLLGEASPVRYIGGIALDVCEFSSLETARTCWIDPVLDTANDASSASIFSFFDIYFAVRYKANSSKSMTFLAAVVLLTLSGLGKDGHGCEKLMNKVCPGWKDNSATCTACVSYSTVINDRL